MMTPSEHVGVCQRWKLWGQGPTFRFDKCTSVHQRTAVTSHALLWVFHTLDATAVSGAGRLRGTQHVMKSKSSRAVPQNASYMAQRQQEQPNVTELQGLSHTSVLYVASVWASNIWNSSVFGCLTTRPDYMLLLNHIHTEWLGCTFSTTSTWSRNKKYSGTE